MAPNEKDLVHQPDSRLKRDRQNCMQALVTQFKISISIVTKINSAQILLNWDLGLEEGAHPMVSCTEGPSPLAAGSLHTLKWKKAPHSPSSWTLGNPASSPHLQGGGHVSGFFSARSSFSFWNPVPTLFLRNSQLPSYWGLPPPPGLRSRGARGGDGGAMLCSCATSFP